MKSQILQHFSQQTATSHVGSVVRSFRTSCLDATRLNANAPAQSEVSPPPESDLTASPPAPPPANTTSHPNQRKSLNSRGRPLLEHFPTGQKPYISVFMSLFEMNLLSEQTQGAAASSLINKSNTSTCRSGCTSHAVHAHVSQNWYAAQVR